MTRPLDLASAQAKVERAQSHANELKDDIRSWLNDETDPPVRPGFEDEPKHRRTLVYAASIKDMNRDWSLLLGDALHDYRSALNHVVGALVLLGSKPELFADPSAIFQFPVCDTTRKDFYDPSGNVRKKQLPGIRRKHLDTLSPFQPYKRRRDRWELPALKLLNDLDKHRKPVLALHYVMALVTVQPLAPLVQHRSLRPRGPVQPGTKLAHLLWLTDREGFVIQAARPWQTSNRPDVTVRFEAPAAVVLQDLVTVRPLDTVINGIDALVGDVLREVRMV